MSFRTRLTLRLHRLLVYWGLLKHPFGRDYVAEHYTPTGGQSTPAGDETASVDRAGVHTGTARPSVSDGDGH
ncbi:hypothetical protein [Natronobiforma cellulositropha]|uniref:hypothetical protein n=1 Tax=Natronobiforma cellulositropha TaxID=1679076 RepID=UPI0021D5CC69|nr:hypothetical protein [Natronobiforma cellulositropha]